ncbi:OmpA family protein [Flammeovirgaceae bacterium SG7u.111]|nr:OmpA family protein [Flammeovirgaceae bacterium SG7u.132]WPO34379.1 OmpA family protein [Flammeovirgaceae bacterium SG7u.111]
MKHNSGNFFWASYADLMTALFIITLTLFVLSYKMFKDKQIRIKAMQEQLDLKSKLMAEKEQDLIEIEGYLVSEKSLADSLIQQLEAEKGRLLVLEQEYRKLKEIEEAISKLDKKYFEYQPKYKRHILKSDVQFKTGSAAIDGKYHEMLKNAGQELKSLIDSLEDKSIKYMLVVEGSASKDNYARNYELSYARALQLYKLWERQGVEFDQDRIQVIISGSGTSGIGRVVGNEKLNQRFLIQIIPKIGTIDLADIEELRELNRQVQEGSVPPEN